MSEAYTTSFPNSSGYTVAPEKQKGHMASWIDHGKRQCKGAANFIISLAIGFVVLGGVAVAITTHYWFEPELSKAKAENLSFSMFSEALKRVDPQEHKNIETLNVICSDKFIHSNPEGDMLDVCMSEHYRRKARVKVASAEGGQ